MRDGDSLLDRMTHPDTVAMHQGRLAVGGMDNRRANLEPPVPGIAVGNLTMAFPTITADQRAAAGGPAASCLSRRGAVQYQ
jgi:hypothetical protein